MTDQLARAAFWLAELSLEGTVRSISGALPMPIDCQLQTILIISIYREEPSEAAISQEITVYGVESLGQLADVPFCSETMLEATTTDVEELLVQPY